MYKCTYVYIDKWAIEEKNTWRFSYKMVHVYFLLCYFVNLLDNYVLKEGCCTFHYLSWTDLVMWSLSDKIKYVEVTTNSVHIVYNLQIRH